MDTTLKLTTTWNQNCGSEILSHLQSLDVLLKMAVARARVLYGVNDECAALRGGFIDEEEIERLVERDEETLGSRLMVTEVLRDFRLSPRIAQLSQRWGFSDFDAATLLLAVAPEVDLRYERIYGYLQDDVTKKRPTVDLALNLLCETQ